MSSSSAPNHAFPVKPHHFLCPTRGGLPSLSLLYKEYLFAVFATFASIFHMAVERISRESFKSLYYERLPPCR